MGNLCPKSIEVDEEEVRRHKEIEEELLKDKAVKTRKLLLLGAGECGKSTVLKQMRLRDASFTDNELLFYKPLITGMLVTSMHALIEAAKEMQPEFTQALDYRFDVDAKVIESIVENGEENHPLGKTAAKAIQTLWKLESIQEAFGSRDRLQVNDSLQYFLNDLERISDENYKPTIQDVLNVRAATIGVQEVRFMEKNVIFKVFDVGGQKSQRRKWIHVFDNVDAIVFISAVSEFNQSMREDLATNRLHDSLNLFSEVANNKYFENTSFILFLNKTDLLKEKLLQQNLSIKSAFPNYQGSNSYEDSIAYIEEEFRAKTTASKRKIIFHQTCAIDTKQIQVVLDAVAEIVVAKKMDKGGVM